MKIKLVFIMLLVISQFSFAEELISDFEYSYLEDTLYFVSYRNRFYEVDVMNNRYVELTDSITIDKNGYFVLSYKGNDQWPFLLTGNDYYLIGGSNQLYFMSNSERINQTYKANENTFITSIEAGTHLVEKTSKGTIEYKAECLRDKFFATDKEFRYELLPSSLPWAISIKEIEKAVLSIKLDSQVSGLIFLNGYVDFKKPHLYKKNSRIESIEISDIVSGATIIVKLKDKIEFQEVTLPFKTDNIKIRFLSFYPGTTYSDVCLSALVPIFDKEMEKKARHYRTSNGEIENGNFLARFKKVKMF